MLWTWKNACSATIEPDVAVYDTTSVGASSTYVLQTYRYNRWEGPLLHHGRYGLLGCLVGDGVLGMRRGVRGDLRQLLLHLRLGAERALGKPDL